MSQSLQREYSSREFNRDPSAIKRSAMYFGRVTITDRGEPSLFVIDATRPTTRRTLADVANSWVDEEIDEDLIGEPPRYTIIPQIPELEDDQIPA